jgi:hypothetical protein
MSNQTMKWEEFWQFITSTSAGKPGDASKSERQKINCMEHIPS